MKASELKESLTNLGFDVAEVDRLVKARIDQGGIEAETATSEEKLVNPEILDEAVDALKKSIAGVSDEAEPVESFADGDILIKGGSADDDSLVDDTATDIDEDIFVQDDSQAIAVIAKGADAIVRRVDDQHKVLASAVLALGKLTQDMAKAMSASSETTANIGDRVELLTKALNIPMEPRSITGSVEAVAAPGESTEKVISKADVVAKAKMLLSEKDIKQHQAHRLVEAVSLLDSGANPAQIAQTYGIPVA